MHKRLIKAARELRHALRVANVAGGDPALNAAIEEFSAALNELDDDGPLEDDEGDQEGLCRVRTRPERLRHV